MWRDVEVAEVIASLPSDIAVLAGAGGLGRRIRRVVVADRSEEFRQVGARDLLMTTVETLRATGEPWEQLVERFEAGGIAGVAVHLVPSSDRPAEFLTAADQASLPVIICSSGATLPEVRAAILAALLEIQGRRLDHVIDVRRRFAALAASTDGLSRLAAALHDMLGVSVAVIDNTPPRAPPFRPRRSARCGRLRQTVRGVCWATR